MKKKIIKKPKNEKCGYNAFTEEPIDISNSIIVGETVQFPEYEINKKIQKKLMKELPFEFINKKVFPLKKDISKEKSFNMKENTKQFAYNSGIIKIVTKNEKDEIIKETVDYSNLKDIYIQNIKKNLNDELELLVNNSFLLYNRKANIKKIVKRPVSTKVLADKLLLWKYYIKELSKEEKAHLPYFS